MYADIMPDVQQSIREDEKVAKSDAKDTRQERQGAKAAKKKKRLLKRFIIVSFPSAGQVR